MFTSHAGCSAALRNRVCITAYGYGGFAPKYCFPGQEGVRAYGCTTGAPVCRTSSCAIRRRFSTRGLPARPPGFALHHTQRREEEIGGGIAKARPKSEQLSPPRRQAPVVQMYRFRFLWYE